jgi:hypothetical protein
MLCLFLILSIGLHASIFVGIVGNHMSHTFSYIILVIWICTTLVFLHHA